MTADNHFKIKDLAEQDRPREKLVLHGADTLSDSELLGILIGTGLVNLSAVEIGREILRQYGNNLNRLGQASYNDLRKFRGIGDAKAIVLLAALELGRRRTLVAALEKPAVCNSIDAFLLLHPKLSDLDHEELWALLLNTSNKVIDTIKIGQGGINSTMADVRILMKAAVDKNATAFIIAHNHPSGNLRPSAEDDKLTNQMRQAGEIMNIRLRDHIIIVPDAISRKRFFSYHDNDKI